MRRLFQKISEYLQNLSIQYKLGLPIFAIILMMLLNQLLNFYFIDNSYQNTEKWLSGLAENKTQSQKIVYLLHTIVFADNNTAKGEVEAINQQIELTILALDKGANVQIGTKKLDLAPITEQSLSLEIQDLREIWKNYRETNTLIITENITLEQSPDTLQNLVMINRNQNAVVKDAFNKALILHEQFIQKIDILVNKLLSTHSQYRKFLTSIENSLLVAQFLFAFIVVYISGSYVVFIIRKVMRSTLALTQGRTDFNLHLNQKDELGQIAQAIQHLSYNIQQASDFTQQIGEGNYEVDLATETQLLAEERNTLFESLITMRNRLKQLAEEDEKRNWITEGLAIFGEVIRSNNQSFQELGDSILSKLVDYLGANQGYFFVLNEEQPTEMCLELVSAYAFQRKKYLQNKYRIYDHHAEGLVGQVYMEKQSILLQELPEDYVSIKSGLGDAPPRNILLVPFQTNQKVEGVIELASFQTFSKYEIEFIERISEGIASAVLGIKINLNTQRLLKETQELASILQSQEQELRQNNEELIATQEEMRRKSLEIEARITAINNSGVASIEFDMEGHILDANQAFLDLFQYKLEEIVGKHHRIFLEPEQAQSRDYWQLWEDLRMGIAKVGEVKRKRKDATIVYLAAAYSVIKDTKGNYIRVLKLATDITATKKLLAETQRQAEVQRAQEETLRANMLKLQSTQDELRQTSEAIIKLKEEEARYAQEKAKEIENKNQLITASIRYAQNIQQAILPTRDKIEEFIEECFIVYLPKDIVSGDFYWYNQVSPNKAFIAAVDCTGHGVPGAFMSIIGNTLLNEIVNGQKEVLPAQVLEMLHTGIYVKLRQEESSNHDGMDVCLCCLEKETENQQIKLTFAGAKRDLYYFREGQLTELKGDRISIGGWHVETRRRFENQTLYLDKGDIVFLSTDGIIDNPNPQRKKFGEKRFQTLLIDNIHLPLEIQKEKILQAIKQHQQDAEQRDDITLLGIKI